MPWPLWFESRPQDLPIWIVVGMLATWRITSIIHSEDIFAFLRRWAGGRENKNGDWVYDDNFIGNLFSCFWCLSVWVGMAVAILVFVFPYVLLPFGLSAFAVWLEMRYFRR